MEPRRPRATAFPLLLGNSKSSGRAFRMVLVRQRDLYEDLEIAIAKAGVRLTPYLFLSSKMLSARLARGKR